MQVGDPFTEKLLMEACLELMKDNSIISIQDMGAAGLTSSSVEMASKGELGIELHLDKVPCREENMTPYEMLLSERKLEVPELGRGITWLDTGNYDNLHEASSLVRQIIKRQGLNVGCIEEILFNSKKISQSEMLNVIKSYPDC